MSDLGVLGQRLKSDFQFFAWNCLKIRTKSGDIIPLKLNRAQKYIHDRIEQQLAEHGMVRALILKSRQQGASTYTEGRLYWRTSLNAGKTAFILTHEDKATKNIFGMARLYHPHGTFSDPVFGTLNAAEAGAMWRMLLGRASSIVVLLIDKRPRIRDQSTE